MKPFIHPTADVSAAAIGEGTKIWNNAQVREGARIGRNCVIGKGVYIDLGVVVGNNVKIENMSSVYQGTEIEDGVFIGPCVCLTNDKLPRAITPDGSLKSGGSGVMAARDWSLGKIRVRYGASIGAHAVVLPGVTIGRWSLVGAGSVVTKDVPDHGLAVGNPARLVGFVCKCGGRVERKRGAAGRCGRCSMAVMIPSQGKR